MSIRTALRQSTVVTLVAVIAGLWLLLSWLQIFETIDLATTGSIGQGALSGILGLAVLAVTLGLLFILFGELGETSPGPEQWPPSE